MFSMFAFHIECGQLLWNMPYWNRLPDLDRIRKATLHKLFSLPALVNLRFFDVKATYIGTWQCCIIRDFVAVKLPLDIVARLHQKPFLVHALLVTCYWEWDSLRCICYCLSRIRNLIYYMLLKILLTGTTERSMMFISLIEAMYDSMLLCHLSTCV